MEHPAEPDSDVATIWRLCTVALLERLEGFVKHRVLQGYFGAESAKPTDFLALRLPKLADELRVQRLREVLPKQVSIGKTAGGDFRTTKLKEYPPALNSALASAFVSCVTDMNEGVSAQTLPSDIAADFQALVLTCFGSSYGPDYHHTG